MPGCRVDWEEGRSWRELILEHGTGFAIKSLASQNEHDESRIRGRFDVVM